MTTTQFVWRMIGIAFLLSAGIGMATLGGDSTLTRWFGIVMAVGALILGWSFVAAKRKSARRDDRA